MVALGAVIMVASILRWIKLWQARSEGVVEDVAATV
jgi:hypothetical protein